MVIGRAVRVLSVCALFLLIESLPAAASNINQFNNAALTGVSQGGTVSGSFSFNSTTHQFSNISISFVSAAFGTINASDPNSINGTYSNGQWSFVWSTWKNGDLIKYKISFNPVTNQFTASGWIANWWDQGKFNYLSVPEGGTPLSYLVLSGIAVLGGIRISGKQRRTTRSSQSG